MGSYAGWSGLRRCRRNCPTLALSGRSRFSTNARNRGAERAAAQRPTAPRAGAFQSRTHYNRWNIRIDKMPFPTVGAPTRGRALRGVSSVAQGPLKAIRGQHRIDIIQPLRAPSPHPASFVWWRTLATPLSTRSVLLQNSENTAFEVLYSASWLCPSAWASYQSW